MSATPVSSQPRRAPWVIVGALGCLVLCLLMVIASGGLYLLFGMSQKQPVTVNLGTPTQVPTLAPTDTPLPPTETPAGPERIAFVSYRDGNAEVYVMNADGSEQTRLTDNPAVDRDPAWSPDGSRIAYMSVRGSDYSIYVMNADPSAGSGQGGSGQTDLTDDTIPHGYPSWSPDGTRIAMTSYPNNYPEIYVMNADPSAGSGQGGSGQTNLTNHPAPNFDPSWSPDGSRIVFVSNRDAEGIIANHEIYVMNANGSEQTRLTDSPGDDWRPTWSPDGQRIAFESSRDGTNAVYVMNADGSGVTRLAEGGSPSWGPSTDSEVSAVSTNKGEKDV